MYRGMIIRKTSEQIDAMAEAGKIQARCLQMLRSKARPGVTTKELDEAAEKFIRSQGAVPSFKGYRGFPGSICTSPNSMVVHGIPGPLRAAARGHPLDRRRRHLRGLGRGRRDHDPHRGRAGGAELLLTATRDALFEGIAQAVPGNHLSDISHAVQRRVERDGLSIIRTLVGHGIGRDMHEDPQIPNFGDPGKGPELEIGMALAIEPMVNAGGAEVRMGSDGWAVYSQDDSLAAHFEFTVAITADGPRILTPWHLD